MNGTTVVRVRKQDEYTCDWLIYLEGAKEVPPFNAPEGIEFMSSHTEIDHGKVSKHLEVDGVIIRRNKPGMPHGILTFVKQAFGSFKILVPKWFETSVRLDDGSITGNIGVVVLTIMEHDNRVFVRIENEDYALTPNDVVARVRVPRASKSSPTPPNMKRSVWGGFSTSNPSRVGAEEPIEYKIRITGYSHQLLEKGEMVPLAEFLANTQKKEKAPDAMSLGSITLAMMALAKKEPSLSAKIYEEICKVELAEVDIN